jgi:hypothetical protein
MTHLTRIAVLVALAAFGLAGCAGCLAHEVPPDVGDDAGDAGDDTNALDTGPAIDSDLDAGPMIDAASCERIDLFRRCDQTCPVMCSGADGRCDYAGQVCRRDFPEETGGFYCAGSWLMAGRTDDGGLGGAGDTCMPIAFCHDAPAAGVRVECVYSDGTPFVNGPASGTCPTATTSVPPCGGACGDTPCAIDATGARPGCVGVSETRSYGLCLRGDGYCQQDPSARFLTTDALSTCPGTYGVTEPCACFVPTPQNLPQTSDAGVTYETGWAIPLSVCHAYATDFPANVRCVDAAWNPI